MAKNFQSHVTILKIHIYVLWSREIYEFWWYSLNYNSNLKKFTENPKDFAKNVFEYTRLCFLISMQIYSVKTKKEFLKLIDKSLLDENSYVELVKLINENCMRIV